MAYEDRFHHDQLPPRMTAYRQAVDIYGQLLKEYLEKYEADNGRPLDKAPETLGYVPFLVAKRINTPLPSIGADAFELHHIALNPADGQRAQDVFSQHRVVEINVLLYRDGSPYVADGDNEEDETGNSYNILLGREGEPIITHDGNFGPDGWVTPERVAAARTVPLSDQECVDLLEALRTNGDDMDTSEIHFG